jgi:hypothetical protein
MTVLKRSRLPARRAGPGRLGAPLRPAALAAAGPNGWRDQPGGNRRRDPPLVLGFGRSADNPSLRPRAYGWGTLS